MLGSQPGTTMKLRARLSLFTGLIILSLVGGISVSTILLLRKVFLTEVRLNQETTLKMCIRDRTSVDKAERHRR